MIYLTYDININNDGLGAQYQRIVGIICISHYYNFIYVHTPIEKMEHTNNLNDIENFFQISNNYLNINSINYDEIFEENNPTIDDLIKYDTKKNILVKIYLPYNICDANTDIYKKYMPKLYNILTNKYLPFYKNNNNKKIAIHVRRGDVTQTQNNSRYTSLDDIIKIIESFKIKYNNCSFYIFTQIDENNKNEFDIFNNDTSIQIKANEDLILTFNHLIHADILVICKSSFSYLAGLYNNNDVYYFNFWHNPLNNWININNLVTIEHFTEIKYFDVYKYLLLILLLLILYYHKNNYIIIIIFCIILFFILNNKEENKEKYTNTGIYTAIIIEPRKHKALEFVLNNFTSMLDDRWNFIIFHGNNNIDYLNEIINTTLKNNIHRIKLININVDNLSIHDYNSLLYDISFYDNIPTETFLIFQTDAMICSDFKDNIYKFIDYDYVGAPWTNKEVGNGGLSLRKKSKMIEILKKCSDKKQYTPTQLHNEDAFFSNICLDKVNINKPNFEDAKEFAMETVPSDNPFGVHKVWVYNNSEQLNNINCPGLNTLIELNKK